VPPVSYSKAIDIWCGGWCTYLSYSPFFIIQIPSKSPSLSGFHLLGIAGVCLRHVHLLQDVLQKYGPTAVDGIGFSSPGRRNSRVMGRLPLYNSSGGCAGGNRHCSRRQSMCPHCHFETPTAQLLAHRPSLRYTPLTGQQFMVGGLLALALFYIGICRTRRRTRCGFGARKCRLSHCRSPTTGRRPFACRRRTTILCWTISISWAAPEAPHIRPRSNQDPASWYPLSGGFRPSAGSRGGWQPRIPQRGPTTSQVSG
jgi:hypothetical protein